MLINPWLLQCRPRQVAQLEAHEYESAMLPVSVVVVHDVAMQGFNGNVQLIYFGTSLISEYLGWSERWLKFSNWTTERHLGCCAVCPGTNTVLLIHVTDVLDGAILAADGLVSVKKASMRSRVMSKPLPFTYSHLLANSSDVELFLWLFVTPQSISFSFWSFLSVNLFPNRASKLLR